MSNWNIPRYSGPMAGVQSRTPVPPPTPVPEVCRVPGLVLWLAPPAAGPQVARWVDRSGKNNHATQPLLPLQPTAVDDGITL